MGEARPSRGRLLVGVASAIAVYLAVTCVWIVFGRSPSAVDVDHDGDRPDPTVVIDVVQIHPDSAGVDVALTLVGGSVLADSAGRLREDVALHVYPTIGQTDIVFRAGAVPDTVSVRLGADGDPTGWPFDTYTIDDVVVAAEVGAERHPVEPHVLVGGSPAGWAVSDVVDDATVAITVDRSTSVRISGILLCLLLISIAGMAILVAVQTLRGVRAYYPPLMSWFGAVLFAVVPLRNALPGAPPMGAWVDRLVVLWVLIAVVAGMGMYVRCWWKAG